jgi:DNA (cytosine-5)-methyltransferase 1
MRHPQIRAWGAELVVDSFAGGGGASTGIAVAIGRDPDIAINHDALAIEMHRANHPHTKHYLESVWKVDPVEACGGRPVGLAWFSPDCTHFSKAKNGKPRSKRVRGLAWVVVRWAQAVRPRVIVLENVEEFADWGPLTADDQPCPRRIGKTFRAFVSKLRRYGYHVEHRLLVAADYGTPTTRKRLFLIARCDGRPIAWPEPTHGRGRPAPWRAAAEIIDWSLPCRSIFGRSKPLAEATMRRIAVGVRRYVLDAARPFLIPVTHPRDARVHSIAEPLRTVTAAHRGELALVVPTLIQTGYGEREGQTPRALDLQRPLGTVVAGGAKHALVAAFVSKHYGSPPDRMRAIGHELGAPLSTVTARDHHAVTAAFLTKFYGTSIGADARAPIPTVTGGGQHIAAVQALLERHAPARGLFDHPAGLIEIGGETYAITDIGMRMLSPRELFRAQGFSDEYRIELVRPTDGKPFSKEDQIALAGNSVCPQVAAAIVRANVDAAQEARTA